MDGHERNRMTLEMPSLSANVGLARVSVATFAAQADFSLAEIEEIRVAVSEAVSNVVVHAYGDEAGTVTVTCRLEDGGLTVIVQDTGRGIDDVDRAREASYSTADDRMGLGFSFITSFMDELELETGTGGTTVRMSKRPTGEPAAAAAGSEGTE